MSRRESEYVGGTSHFDVAIPYDDVSVLVVNTDEDLYRISGKGEKASYERVYQKKKKFKVVDRTSLSVQVDLVVEKKSYDDAADACQSAVNALTGSVAAVQSHQVAEIKSLGMRVAKTISNGFFGLVKSEISQQMVEIEKKAESLGGKLMELTELLEKQRLTMEEDYALISSRYIKIFSALDEDCNRRIRALDKRAFEIKEAYDSLGAKRMDETGCVGTLLDAIEKPNLQAQLTASAMRKKFHDSIGCISAVLDQEQAYEKYLKAVTYNTVTDSTYDFAPVMMVSSISLNGEQEIIDAYTVDAFSGELKNVLSKAVLNQIDLNKQSVSVEDKKRLDECFNVESERWMNQINFGDVEKNKRVLETLNKMWRKNLLD